jgi:hypothetical protein
MKKDKHFLNGTKINYKQKPCGHRPHGFMLQIIFLLLSQLMLRRLAGVVLCPARSKTRANP